MAYLTFNKGQWLAELWIFQLFHSFSWSNMIPRLLFVLLATITVILSLSAEQSRYFVYYCRKKPFRRKVALLVVKQILSVCKRSVLRAAARKNRQLHFSDPLVEFLIFHLKIPLD